MSKKLRAAFGRPNRDMAVRCDPAAMRCRRIRLHLAQAECRVAEFSPPPRLKSDRQRPELFVLQTDAVASQLRFRSPRARRHTERLGRFQILDNRAEVDGLWIKSLIFGDFGAIQNFETVALEHLFAAPAFKRHDLPVNTFFAATIEITQIRAHQRARRRHFSSVGKKIDVKMGNAPRRRRHFPPAVRQCPTNESPRGLVIPEIAGERFEKERNVLPKRIELVQQRFARTEQITPNLAVDLNHERRFRFPIRIVSREKIGEQLSIFVDWIDWRSEKPRLTT